VRSLWATVFATWALFAVLAVLAWTRPLPVAPAAPVPGAVVVTGKNGQSHLVVVQNGAAPSQATTRTSPVPAG
jgi:tellurite resistance protein TehA-like permease